MRQKKWFRVSLAAVMLVLITIGGLRIAGAKSLPVPGGDSLGVTVAVSKPANGSFFAAGERAVVTVTLKDKAGAALAKEDLSTLGLYAYGPQETTKTVTAVKLLNATADRSKTPHHYIDLLTNPDVKVSGNVLTYTLQPVTGEEPGTYTATVRAVKKGDPPLQNFALADFQVGTATVEKQIVERENCAACHQGAQNGQFYFAHSDTSARNPFGSPAIDSWAVRTCKSCHNNDGYAAYRGNVADPTGPTTARTPDPIVRRVHGLHMGEGLENTFNTDPTNGDFARYGYTNVVFPANVKNCATCHVDNRWKTQPSRQACGACHDATWFGETAAMPATFTAHKGGPQANDASCAVCHPADSGGLKAVAVAHNVAPPPFKYAVQLVMSMPKNGKFFTAGEMPQVGVIVKDAATGAVINPNTIVEPADSSKVQPNEWRRANLYVSGPRSNTVPVLTSKATQVGATASSYASNDFRLPKDATKADARFIRSDSKITYQLDDVKGLAPGTYTAFVEIMPAAPNIGGWGIFNFQVGTETAEKVVATNCTNCHDNTTMHTSYFAVQFNPDICKNCHDNKRQITGKSGWNNSNNGFGAAPLARRVHGVHFGAYLDKPKEVHATYDFSEVIFPQDVRNCEKCHSANTSGTWKEKPSRVACLACHDSDAAIGHAALQTIDATAAEPYSGDETETCAVCHGKGRELSPDKVHNISDPYKPPYPREKE